MAQYQYGLQPSNSLWYQIASYENSCLSGSITSSPGEAIMKAIIRSMFFIVIIYSSYSEASDCRVIEYPDRNEVVCEGYPEKLAAPASDKARQIEEVRQERDQVQQALEAEQKNADVIAIKIQDKKQEIEDMKRKFAEDNKRFNEKYGR